MVKASAILLPHRDLNTRKLDGTYHFRNKHKAAIEYSKTWGMAAPVLYAQVPIEGSVNCPPKSSRYILQSAFWLGQNTGFKAQYMEYPKFTGGTTNHGARRKNALGNDVDSFISWPLI